MISLMGSCFSVAHVAPTAQLCRSSHSVSSVSGHEAHACPLGRVKSVLSVYCCVGKEEEEKKSVMFFEVVLSSRLL